MPRRRLFLALSATLVLAGCTARESGADPPPDPAGASRVTIAAVGDILMHHDVKQAAAQNGGFEFLWAEMAPIFQGADLVFGNLETPVAPLMGQPGKPYLFNAPADLPQALRQSGFTVLSTANNHTYDQGDRGLHETLSRLEVARMVSIGSGRSRAQAEAPRILERNGIRIAFLAWTDLFNRQFNREGQGPWVNALDATRACEAVRAARGQADAVIVSVHWGREDQHEPTPRQRELAALLFEAGADLILGHHPHVLQPLDVTESGGRRVAVAYSLGNFISNQNRIYDVSRMDVAQGDARDGAAVVATFVRTPAGAVTLDTIGYTPLWTENNWRAANAGLATQRDIRVVRLDAPERQSEPWVRRRERIREILGHGLENRLQTAKPTGP